MINKIFENENLKLKLKKSAAEGVSDFFLFQLQGARHQEQSARLAIEGGRETNA